MPGPELAQISATEVPRASYRTAGYSRGKGFSARMPKTQRMRRPQPALRCYLSFNATVRFRYRLHHVPLLNPAGWRFRE